MNNAKFVVTESSSQLNIPLLRERETELVRLLEALTNIHNSQYWSTVMNDVLQKDINLIKKKIVEETDTTEIFRLQGILQWTSTHLDLERLITQYRHELTRIKLQLNGNQEN